MIARHCRFATAILLIICGPATSAPAVQNPKVREHASDIELIAADGPPVLTWEMLVPAMSPLENPYESWPADQLDFVDARKYLDSFLPEQKSEFAAEYEAAKKEAAIAKQKLAGQKVNPEDIYKRYMDWAKEVDRRGHSTIKDLDGKRVAIAGYLLPLDFNEAGTTEFLLVPYIGACIHVPPPPPNQVVYVKAAKPHQVTEIFDGVKVIGVMRIASASKDLSLVDGAGAVETGYTLDAESIEPYQFDEGGQ